MESEGLMNSVERAIQLALTAHAGQVDKAGKPYILHPLAVASMQDTEEGFIVGMLHDVVEDSKITLPDLLKWGFSFEVVEAVELLTHAKGEDYMTYVKRIKGNALATKVKLADLKHNSDLSRLPLITQKDVRRVEEKYKPAIEYLSQSV